MKCLWYKNKICLNVLENNFLYSEFMGYEAEGTFWPLFFSTKVSRIAPYIAATFLARSIVLHGAVRPLFSQVSI